CLLLCLLDSPPHPLHTLSLHDALPIFEAVEIPHRLHSARQDLPMIPVPRMTKVSPVEKQDESETAIRDFMDELADFLVIDDDHSGFLRHEGRDPGIIEISWTSPLRHRCS